MITSLDLPDEHGFEDGPWTHDGAYRSMLMAEAMALRAGDDVTPNAHHVCVVIDMLLDLSKRTDRLSSLVTVLLDRDTENVAPKPPKRWSVRQTPDDGKTKE